MSFLARNLENPGEESGGKSSARRITEEGEGRRVESERSEAMFLTR